MSAPRRYRCSAAARWLPRVLAGSVLAAAMLASFRIDPRVDSLGWGPLRAFVVVAGALLALFILRRAAEVRIEVELDGEALRFRSGTREATLPWADLESVEYATPLSASRYWLPAAVLIDRRGRAFRLSALLDGGDRLVDDLLAVTGRADLEAWVQALHLRRRLGRARKICAAGYAAATALLAAAVAFYLLGPTA